MLWHVVKFRFAADADAAAREQLATALAGLTDQIAELRFLRVGPSIDEPDVLGLLTGFDDEAGLAVYRDDPAHLPVLAQAKALCAEIVRLDIVSDDPGDILPLR